MFLLITGGSGSGKSEFAENYITKLGAKKLYYIATMYPLSRESQEKVERHRRMRRGKGFQTIECYTGLKNVEVEDGSVILVECMSNLLANEMFQKGGVGEANAYEEIVTGVERLKEKAEHLVLITNEVFSDGKKYDPSMTGYIRNLGYINCQLASEADGVAEIVYSIPIYHKGAEYFEISE